MVHWNFKFSYIKFLCKAFVYCDFTTIAPPWAFTNILQTLYLSEYATYFSFSVFFFNSAVSMAGNYFCDRFLSVLRLSTTSNLFDMGCWSSQGSVLSPLLFTMLINDLHIVFHFSKFPKCLLTIFNFTIEPDRANNV